MNMSTRMTTMVGNSDHEDNQRHRHRRRNHRRRRRRCHHRHRCLWYAPRSLTPFPPSYLPTCTLPPPYLPTFLTSHLPALLPPYLRTSLTHPLTRSLTQLHPLSLTAMVPRQTTPTNQLNLDTSHSLIHRHGPATNRPIRLDIIKEPNV